MSDYETGIFSSSNFLKYMAIRMSGIKKENAILEGVLSYKNPETKGEKKAVLHIKNKLKMQQWLHIALYTDDEMSLKQGSREYCIDQFHGGTSISTIELDIVTGEFNKSRFKGVLEVTSKGRAEALYFPVVLINRRDMTLTDERG